MSIVVLFRGRTDWWWQLTLLRSEQAMIALHELPRRPLVLLVDDDAENRRLVREVLEAEGLSVIGEAAAECGVLGRIALDP